MKEFRMVRVYKKGLRYGPWRNANQETVEKWSRYGEMSNKLYHNKWYLEFR